MYLYVLMYCVCLYMKYSIKYHYFVCTCVFLCNYISYLMVKFSFSVKCCFIVIHMFIHVVYIYVTELFYILLSIMYFTCLYMKCFIQYYFVCTCIYLCNLYFIYAGKCLFSVTCCVNVMKMSCNYSIFVIKMSYFCFNYISSLLVTVSFSVKCVKNMILVCFLMFFMHFSCFLHVFDRFLFNYDGKGLFFSKNMSKIVKGTSLGQFLDLSSLVCWHHDPIFGQNAKIVSRGVHIDHFFAVFGMFLE